MAEDGREVNCFREKVLQTNGFATKQAGVRAHSLCNRTWVE